MSILLAAITNVAQAVVASPTPLPSPLVVHDTITKLVTVPAVSPELMKAAQVALLFVAGLGGSWFHQFIEALSKRKDGFSTGVNVSIQFLFGILVAALAAFVSGNLHLTVDSALDFLASLLVVLGTSQGRYMFKKWTESLGSDEPLPSPTAQSQAGLVDEVPRKAAV